MTKEQAIDILAGVVKVEPDGLTMGDREYIGWTVGAERACLDGDFTADELEAVAVYMRCLTED